MNSMNKITQQEFKEKKDTVVSVYSFDSVTHKRGSSYTGISLFTAIDEIQKHQYQGRIAMILTIAQHEQASKIEGFGLRDRISLESVQALISKDESFIINS